MFIPAPAHGRHAHYLFAAALFAILGFHVGVWAVQLAPLSAGLRLDPAALGAAVTVAASAGLVTLFAGGALADRACRRPVLVIGFAGTGTAFVLMALAGRFATLIPGMLLYGLSVSFIDLGANTVGSAYEQAYKVTAMTGLHAWFSGGALAGAIGSAAALRAGVGYRGVYLALAAVLAAGLVTALLAAIPAPPAARRGSETGVTPRQAAGLADPRSAVRHRADQRDVLRRRRAGELPVQLPPAHPGRGRAAQRHRHRQLPLRLAARAAHRDRGAAPLRGAPRRHGRGPGGRTGLLTAVTAPDAAGAIGGLLLVGFAIAPVVPTTLSLAGRSAPGRSGQAVATATAAGYGSFILSPLTIGLIAQATSLRLALGLLVLTSLAIAGLATRWPTASAIPPGSAPPVVGDRGSIYHHSTK